MRYIRELIENARVSLFEPKPAYVVNSPQSRFQPTILISVEELVRTRSDQTDLVFVFNLHFFCNLATLSSRAIKSFTWCAVLCDVIGVCFVLWCTVLWCMLCFRVYCAVVYALCYGVLCCGVCCVLWCTVLWCMLWCVVCGVYYTVVCGVVCGVVCTVLCGV